VQDGPWKLPCFRRVDCKVVLDIPASPWAKGFEPFLLESLDALERAEKSRRNHVRTHRFGAPGVIFQPAAGGRAVEGEVEKACEAQLPTAQ
jgi:hypothetical protein